VSDGEGLSSTEQALGEQLLRLHTDSYGKGAGSSRVHILNDLVICVMDDLELMPNEQFLVDAGHRDSVIEVRSRYQQAIETTFRAAVERATGRRVISFVSATKLDPHYSLEVFRLAPRDDTRPAEPEDG
jgi:uncharacterized protein YbcI